MKGKTAFVLVILSISCFIILGMIGYADTKDFTDSLVTDDLYGVKYTPICLTECHLPLELKWNKVKNIIKDELKVHKESIIGNDNFYRFEIRILTDENYWETEYTTEEVCEMEDTNTTPVEKCRIVKTPVQVEKTRKVWKEITDNFNTAIDKIIYIDFVGFKKASLGYNAIDIVPEVDGVLLDEYAWWDGDWSYKRKIDLHGLEEDVSNYVINFTYDTSALVGAGKLQADCDDIRFTEETEAMSLSYTYENRSSDIYGCNQDSTQFYIEIPTLEADNSTYIYMYYGNPSAVSGEDTLNTFTEADFVMLGWADATTAFSAKGGFNGTLKNQIHLDSTGILGNTFDLDGTDDFINYGDHYDPSDLNELTLTGWLYATQSAVHNTFISKTDSSAGRSYSCSMRSSADGYKIYFGYDAFQSEKSSGNARWVLNQWNYVVCLFDFTVDQVNFTVNMTSDSGNPQNPDSDLLATVYDMCIGGACNGDPANTVLNDFQGYIDDVRLYHEARSPAWLKLDWAYVMDSTMVIVNSEEAGSVPEKAPYWTNNITDYPPVYSPSIPTVFNLTWTNNSENAPVNITNVVFRSNFTNATMSLISGNMWSGVYGYEIILPAGHYQWWGKAYNNESSPKDNTTDLWKFVLPQASPTCTLTGATGTITYGATTTPLCSCTNTDVASKLYRDDVDVTATENNTALVLSGGSHSYVCNTTATQNYTSATDSDTRTVNKANNIMDVWFNGARNQNYSLSAGGVLNVTLKQTSSQGTYIALEENGTVKFNSTNLTGNYYNSTLAEGSIYRYRIKATGNENYSDNSTENIDYYVTVTSLLTVDVKDELTNGDITFNITLSNSTFEYTEYDLALFTANASNMPYGNITVLYSAYGYPARVSYLTNITPGSQESITLYLLSVNEGIYVTYFTYSNTNPAGESNVTVIASTLIGSNWTEVDARTSDDEGKGYLFLYPYSIHRITAYDTDGYTTTLSNYYPSSAFLLRLRIDDETAGQNQTWHFTNIRYSLLPENVYIYNSSDNLTSFNYTIQSLDGKLQFYGMNLTLDGVTLYSNNTTGSNTTGFILVDFNMTGRENKILTVTTWFKKEGYDVWSWNRNYTIVEKHSYLPGAIQDLAGGLGLSGVVGNMVALFVSIAVSGGSKRLLQQAGGSIVFLLVLAVFVFLGFFNWLLYLNLALIGVIFIAGSKYW